VNPNWPIAIKIYDTENDLPDIGPLESDLVIGYRKREDSTSSVRFVVWRDGPAPLNGLPSKQALRFRAYPTG
jgi:hypothetical protein